MVPSNDAAQSCMCVAGGANIQVHALRRADGVEVCTCGRKAGQFHWVHNIAQEAQGNLYTSEVDTGKRLPHFTPLP